MYVYIYLHTYLYAYYALLNTESSTQWSVTTWRGRIGWEMGGRFRR